MPALVEPPLLLRSPASAGLRFTPPLIRREGISWTGGAGGQPLVVRLEFENPDAQPSAATLARIDVAPFGAFLPWRPLGRVAVPSLPSGSRRVITVTVDAGTALPPPPRSVVPAAGGLHFEDLRTFLCRMQSCHFVGNLNVFVTRRKPVERHVKHSVGLRPGSENVALFSVGDGRSDVYTFSIGRQEPGWDLRLAGAGWETPTAIAHATVGLCIRPPRKADSARARVDVHRASTGETVPVEFELDVEVAGSKCYFF